MDKEEYMYGRKIIDINSIYKGDGITTCKWCGDTGMMHTFSNDGYFYNDAPCWCKAGRELMRKEDDKQTPKKKRLPRRKRCADCGIDWADEPSSLCPCCEAYRDHTAI